MTLSPTTVFRVFPSASILLLTLLSPNPSVHSWAPPRRPFLLEGTLTIVPRRCATQRNGRTSATLSGSPERTNGVSDGEACNSFSDDKARDDDNQHPTISGGIIEGIEGAVRSVGLGGEDYKFGDLTRRAVLDMKEATEEAVRAATGDETYEFGDLTKRAASEMAKTAEATVKAVTENEDLKLYQYSRALLKEQDRIVSEMISDNLGDYNVPVVENLTPRQRRGLIHAAIQMLALGCLCLHFVMNLFSGATVVAAWVSAAAKTGISPLSSTSSWQVFLSAHSALKIFAGPVTMPVQCIAALFLAPRYRNLLLTLQTRFAKIDDGKVRLIHRVGAVALAWLVGNCLGIAAVTFGCIWIFSMSLGVSIR